MKHFETLIARYNATLPTITDGCPQHLQLTENGVLITTIRDTDGSDVIVTTGEDVSGGGDRGFIAYGIDSNDQAQPLSVDSNGYLEVALNQPITVDFSQGTDQDKGSDEAGAETEPGIICNITGSYVDIVSIPITSGSTLAIEAFDASADILGQFQLVVESNAGTRYVRTMLVTENVGTNQIVFPRPKEVTAIDNSTFLVLKGKTLRADCGGVMCASGGINAYLLPE